MGSDKLHSARRRAELVRYSEDTPSKQQRSNSKGARHSLSGLLSQTSLEISADVTPSLDAVLTNVYDNLAIPRERILAFVYASANLQAECHMASAESCNITFSSALIDLLSAEEVAFVAGHEIGHFLLQHGIGDENDDSIESYIEKRCREISSDRVGLLACRSLDVAIRALMKTVSGLSSEHLRFDVGRFLRQLSHVDGPEKLLHGQSSHPSVLVRCRALLWFSLSKCYEKGIDSSNAQELQSLDRRVTRDMELYVDGPLRERIRGAKESVGIWTAALEIAADGQFDRAEQRMFEEMFGNENLVRLRTFLSELSSASAVEEIQARLDDARRELAQLIPRSFDREAAFISESVSKKLERY